MKKGLDVIKNKKRLVVGYLILGVIIAFLSVVSTSYFQKVLDDFSNHKLTGLTIGIYSSLLLSVCLLNYLDEYPSCKLSNSIYLDLKIRALEKIGVIDYQIYQSMGTGNLIQRIENGAEAGKNIFCSYYFRLIREIVPTIIFSLIFIASINTSIMLYIAIGYIFVFSVTNILLKYLYKIKEHILNHEEVLSKYLVRVLMEMATFRMNKRFKYELEKAKSSSEIVVNSRVQMQMIHEAFFAIFAVFIAVIKVIILIISWKLNSLSVGGVVALLTLIDKAYTPIAIFNVLYVEYKLDANAYKRYLYFLQTPDDEQLGQGNKVDCVEGDIQFHKVQFTYDKNEVFNNLSFHIPKGNVVAFVGESGSGKSTIIKQMVGLIKPTKGTIFIDQQDLAQLDLNSYYDYISYISQDSPVFNGSIRENIIFDKEMSDEEIFKVLKLVSLDVLIRNLPEALDTVIGERGVKLSGGERQRLALARIYFEKSKIIILDEATSAIDNVTEELVMKNLLKFLDGKTVIIIAHRLNSIRDVDTIYICRKGIIEAQGTFDELLKENTYFKQLWNDSKEK